MTQLVQYFRRNGFKALQRLTGVHRFYSADYFGVEQQYDLFSERVRKGRENMLQSPTRFQSILERENRSSLPVDAIIALSKGRWLIQHRGCTMLKSADDKAIITELFTRVKPATVIELGSFCGGNAISMADTLKLEDIDCSIYSMEIDMGLIEDRVKELQPNNVTFLEGDCNKIEETFTSDFMRSLPRPLIVIEDSHVNLTGTMEYFSSFMKTGDYFVIEDTNPNGLAHTGGEEYHPDKPSYTPCGYDKLNEMRSFLAKQGSKFAVDTYFTDFFGYNGTWNWDGFVRRM